MALPPDDVGPSPGIDVSEAERWKRVKEVFDAAVGSRVEDRSAMVRDLCGDDRVLQADVESLLAADRRNGMVFEPPVDQVLRGRLFDAVGDALEAETRAFAPGDRLGVYEITGFLGAGGMGRVYRARDTTLGRDVALKTLPALWLANPDRRARFEREARLLATLNHPNIGSIYGVHESDAATSSGLAVKALVLELVEGETLADRIAPRAQPAVSPRGLPVDEVVSIASQVIEALEAAHERGIVHRDLKPANIKITPGGQVKVLDFGLARAMGGTGSGPEIVDSPTLTIGATQDGVLLGTAPYMSPEQARGRTVDKRTDIWAFGCVLYEMLTGAPAFAGDGVAEVLAVVIKGEPDWTALPADTPAALRLCLTRCLQKDLRQRFHDIADARLAMEGAFEQPAGDSDRSQRGRPSYARLAYAGWAIALLATAAAFAISAFAPRGAADVSETRLEIVTPPARDPMALAISPDGRSIVFQAGQDPPRLWLRTLDSQEARPLAGTEGGVFPFWAPDGRSIAFTAAGTLKRLDLASGLVRTLASRSAFGGSWNEEGTILMGSGIGPLHSVPEDGGPARQATDLLPGQITHRWPQFLPDGRRFLLYTLGNNGVRGVYLGSLTDPLVQRISDRESGFGVLPPAHVLFARQGALWARELARGFTSVGGEFLPVAAKVLVHPAIFGYTAFSSSSTGSIAYRASAGETQLVWLDRSGRPAAVVGQADDGQVFLSQLSRDGRTVATTRTVAGSTNVWLLDTERGVPRRLTFDFNDNAVIFSPDGSRIAHQAEGNRERTVVWERRSDGTGREAMLLAEPDEHEFHHPQDWSSDGRYILYTVDTTANSDLRALPLFGERTPFDVARTSFNESNGRFSPDARWVAFQSNETGRAEIHVQPFPGPGPKSQVSVGGGTLPRWPSAGRELFYLAPDNRLMAVPVTISGSRLETGPPSALFTLSTTSSYEPSPDGQRFLVTSVVSEASPITVILNWKPPSK
jgi:eukaryotic-like serine/threonine-protein kinase